MSASPFESPELDGTDSCSARQSILRLLGRRLCWLLLAGLVVGLLLPAFQIGHGPSVPYRTACLGNLARLAGAIRQYEVIHGTLSPAFIVDGQGRPLHSWRALILPYIGEDELFEQIDFTKPWDAPENAGARKAVIPAFACPALGKLPTGHTTYMVVIAADSCFPGSQPVRTGEIFDDPAETLLVVEVCKAQAVHWMAPVDVDESMVLIVPPHTPTRRNRAPHGSGFNALFADGVARPVPVDVTRADCRALISIAGHDSCEWLEEWNRQH
jgi:prepilin-type processing-associated H-X9-DG protein